MEDSQRVKFVGTLLRGRAKGWLHRLAVMNQVPNSWAEFKAALIKEFKPTHALKIARDTLATLQQTRTVEEYVDTFQNLALEIPDMSAAEALDRFEREHVRDMEPQNLASAFRIALDFLRAVVRQPKRLWVYNRHRPCNSQPPDSLWETTWIWMQCSSDKLGTKAGKTPSDAFSVEAETIRMPVQAVSLARGPATGVKDVARRWTDALRAIKMKRRLLTFWQRRMIFSKRTPVLVP